MSQAFSLPEIPELSDEELRSQVQKKRLTETSFNAFRNLSVASLTIASLSDPGSQAPVGIDWRRKEIVLGHISKIISLQGSLLKLASDHKHREACEAICSQIFTAALQAIWIKSATETQIRTYLSASYGLEIEQLIAIRSKPEGYSPAHTKFLEELLASVGIDVASINEFDFHPTYEKMIEDLNLDAKVRALLDIGARSDAHVHMHIQSLVLANDDDGLTIDPPLRRVAALRILAAAKSICLLFKTYCRDLTTQEAANDDFVDYFSRYESWIDKLLDSATSREFGVDRTANETDSTESGRDMERPNTSDLSSHRRNGKILQPPLLRMPSISRTSWTNNRLPEYLWIQLIVTQMDRLEAIKNLKMLIHALVNAGLRGGRSAFADIALLPESDRRLFLEILFADEARAKCLKNLAVLKGLPAAEDWTNHLTSAVDVQTGWRAIAKAAGLGLFHQAQEATDTRWFVVTYRTACGLMHFPSNEFYKELFEYPDYADQRAVRPHIRTSEMMLPIGADSEPLQESPTDWSLEFWKQTSEATSCETRNSGVPTQPLLPTDLSPSALWRIANELSYSYMDQRETTAIDPRTDSVYGLTLYAVRLALDLLASDATVASTILLRSVCEVAINLKYLLKDETPERWELYRDYGIGQAKLILLKTREPQAKPPTYLPVEHLKTIANEDRWEEFVSINIGDWSNDSIRSRAEKTGLKEVYDQYFVWPSQASHSHWAAVRFSCFDTCMNPLHRAHRVAVLNYQLPTVKYDLEKLLNVIFDLFNQAYPDRKISLKASFNEELANDEAD